MTIHMIAEGLYKDHRINDLLSKLEPAELRTDLLHHCILYLYRTATKWPGKIEGMHERGELFAWFQRCVKMELIGTNSAFRRTFRTQFEGEEVLMTNDHISRISDSRQVATAQTEQDQQAEARHGKQFVDYFYDNYHRRQERKDKMLRPALQTKQAVLFD